MKRRTSSSLSCGSRVCVYRRRSAASLVTEPAGPPHMKRKNGLSITWTDRPVSRGRLGAMASSPTGDGSHEPEARERILDSSYELFSQRGVQAVGVDEVIENAGVAKATLYRHFPSKTDLVIAFLERREERWSR